jgi:hypothetical protein
MKTPNLIRWSFALLVLAACGEREGDFSQSLALRNDAVGIDKSLVMLTDSSNKALVLKLEPLAQEPIVLDLPSNPALLQKRLGDDVEEALVLCRGERATAREDAQPSVLGVITANGRMREYTLGSPFDELTQSDDGRYALAYRTNTMSDRLLENPNEIAIVDLDADEDDDDAVHRRTLRSFGDAPSKIVFSPTMNILGEDRRLAIVFSTRNVTLIDLEHLDREETTVQLSQEVGTAVTPTQVLFSTTDPVLYVRGSTADDLFAFDLTARPGGIEDDEGGLHNDFRPTINQLGVGTRPTDMALYDVGGETRLITLTDSGANAIVVSTSTGQATTVELDQIARSILVFEATSPGDDTSAVRALLYDLGSSSVTFADLEHIEERLSRNLDTLPLEQPIVRLIPMLSESLALAIHENGVSLIDLAGRTVSPISSNANLEDALFDEVGRRFWVGPMGQPWVGVLDLETGTPGEVLLDANIAQIVPLFGAGLMAVIHTNQVGHVTVLDLDDPTRDSARSVRGFLLSAALTGGEP